MLRSLFSVAVLLCSAMLLAQHDTVTVPHSKYGWRLSPHGTIRVLLVFVEVEYEDPARNAGMGTERWRKGQLPTWKDDVFDPFPLPTPQATVTRYYHDISLGSFQVLGDYIDTIVTIRESELGLHRNGHATGQMAVKALNAMGGELRTRHGLAVADFDLWKRNGRPGMPKEPGPDDPHSYDHTMFISRNGALHPNTGSTDAGSPGKLFGHESDTQSRFGSGGGLPFGILKHEFNHLLLGGNNFHSGGGNAAAFTSYLMALQGGWSMMGAASSSLLTCSAWDRDRLGWMPADAVYRVRARDPAGREVNTDLDPLAGDTGMFILRDFVTTGDALRIKLPYLDPEEYPQFLWLENHQGWHLNGSPTDRFHYEREMECAEGVRPGIHMVMQVDREQREGADLYGGHADYLRAFPASGFHDLSVRGDTVQYHCLWGGRTLPLVYGRKDMNALTGASELEIPLIDVRGEDKLMRDKDGVQPRVEVRDGQYYEGSMLFGHPRQIFTPEGNNMLSGTTNPALANMMTCTSRPGVPLHAYKRPDNRVVHLSDIHLRIMEQRADGAMVVRVDRGTMILDRDVRWCADSIVLHRPAQADGIAVRIPARRTLTVDRSRAPTRITDPVTVKGRRWFNDPTRLTVEPGTHIEVERRGRLKVGNGSTIHLMSGSSVRASGNGRVVVDAGSRLVLHDDARVEAKARWLRNMVRKGRIVQAP